MGHEPLRLTNASWRDFWSLLRLERVCFGNDAWPWFDVLAALIYPGTVRLMAEIGDRPVGFVVADRRQQGEVGWIASLGVHPAYRRQGVGSRLLAAAESGLQTQRVRLLVRASNHGAQALYLQAGYAYIDEWPRYYLDGENAMVMEKVRRMYTA